MKKSVGRIGIPYLTVIAGIIGYFFHASLQGGGGSLPIIAFSVLMSLLFLLSPMLFLLFLFRRLPMPVP